MAETQVAKNEGQDMRAAHAHETETTYIPDVDITESNECVHLVADMPGVNQASVDVTVENNVLTIEGQASVQSPEGYELVGQEYGVGKYRRDFTLSNDVDTENIKARVRHGVLEVTIPKREQVKTKKIKIEA
jgi:HSP20 family protein